MRVFALFACLLFLQQPVGAQDKPGKDKEWKAPVPPLKLESPLKCLDGKVVAFIVNGSGDSRSITDTLNDILAVKPAPVVPYTLAWCRFGQSWQDHTDMEGQLNAARCLAKSILAVRHEAPNARIVLVGHSAGTHVVLKAAESVPDKTVDRIFLLGASVSPDYDLRGALRASRGGIDNYWSEWDSLLEVAAFVLGTADGKKAPCAGRVGFCPPADPELARQLRQHLWNESYGHNGDHYFWTREPFVRRFLLPQFFLVPVAKAPAAKAPVK